MALTVYQGKTPKLKHNDSFNEARDKAALIMTVPSEDSIQNRCPYIFSSNMSDAFWITAWCIYHHGHIPTILHKSKGYTWFTEVNGFTYKLEVLEACQRNGIKEEVIYSH